MRTDCFDPQSRVSEETSTTNPHANSYTLLVKEMVSEIHEVHVKMKFTFVSMIDVRTYDTAEQWLIFCRTQRHLNMTKNCYFQPKIVY